MTEFEFSDVLTRFIRYAAFGTQAIEDAGTVPSSPGQLELGKSLAAELRDIGLEDASCDEHAYVFATLPANTDAKIPTFALVAHLDTATEVSGDNVKPRVIRYEGGDIGLSQDVKIAASDFPELAKWVGEELVVTDGSTLLGADDKAGVAAIVSAVEWYADHPEAVHGTVKVVFTPDEEIGHQAALLDTEKLGAEFAYTVDGCEMGELCWETFNAAKAVVTIKGRSVHTGSAKGKMKNALLILHEFIGELPPGEVPAETEGREGFFHLSHASGEVESATATFLVRDHDAEKFEARKSALLAIASELNARYGDGTAVVEITDSYFNMADVLKDKMHVVEYAREAMRRAGIEPSEIPIRGGTDGSALSWRGLPTPNIFTGCQNAHGRQEFLPVKALEKSFETVKNLIAVVAEARHDAN